MNTTKAILLGAALVIGCAGTDDSGEAVFEAHELRVHDGEIFCTHGEGPVPEEVEKVTIKLPTKTGEASVFTDRIIPDSSHVRWKFDATCNKFSEYRDMARLGIQELFQQNWTFSALVPLQTWTQQEVTSGQDVTISCEVTSPCAVAGTCDSIGSAGFTGTRRLAGTVDGISYYTATTARIRASVIMMTNWAHNLAVQGSLSPGYDETWARSNMFFYLTQHEMAHNLGVRHRNIAGNTKYLNDSAVPIPGLFGYTGTPANTDQVPLTPCSYERLRRIETAEGTPTSLTLGPIPSQCPGDDKF
jgi:hypothetical protein